MAFPDPSGYVLKCVGSVWTIVSQPAAAAGSTGYVQFNSGGALAGTSNLFWNNATFRLGIGSSSPVSTLDLSRNTDALALPVGTTGQEPGSPLNGMIRYNTTIGDLEAYIAGAWTSLTTGGSSASIYLGAGASAPNPAAGAGDLQTGLYTSGAGHADVASAGTQVADFSTAGLNLGTSASTPGALKIGGANGISYPTNDTNCPGCSIAIGPSALSNMPAMPVGTAFYGNIAIGTQALSSASMTTAATYNTAVGYNALQSVTSGNSNTAAGQDALEKITSGGASTGIGRNALIFNTGSNNAAVGYAAGQGINGSSTATDMALFGYEAGFGITTGSGNALVGMFAGTSITTGKNNAALGFEAGQYISTGSSNVALGYSAMVGIGTTAEVTGSFNTVVGQNAGSSMQGAVASDTLFGSSAGSAITTGLSNVVIGPNVASTTLNTGSNNILIGTSSSVDTPTAGTANFLDIGNVIFATGMTGTLTSPAGNVGIGTTTMANKLEVNGATSIGYPDIAAPSNGMIVQGNVGIGTTVPAYLLHVGSPSAVGVVADLQNSSGYCTMSPSASGILTTCNSDIRLKTDIRDADDALAWLDSMHLRNFRMRATGERRTGVIAQEVMRIHPDMVHMGGNGFYTVEVPDTWRLVKAIQQLKAENDQEAAEIRELRGEVSELHREIRPQ